MIATASDERSSATEGLIQVQEAESNIVEITTEMVVVGKRRGTRDDQEKGPKQSGSAPLEGTTAKTRGPSRGLDGDLQCLTRQIVR